MYSENEDFKNHNTKMCVLCKKNLPVDFFQYGRTICVRCWITKIQTDVANLVRRISLGLPITKKICHRCGSRRYAKNFYVNNAEPDKLSAYCIKCMTEKTK